MNPVIRNAVEADLPAIVDIYNQSIPAGWSTADTRPITVAERVEWFRKFDPANRPIWVAEIDGQVVGVTYLSSFYAGRPAYDATAEISVYVATAQHGQGLGRRLKEFVIGECPKLGVTTLLSMHFDHNEATRRINESLGFQPMGHLTEIAVVQGQLRGLVNFRTPHPAAAAVTSLKQSTRAAAEEPETMRRIAGRQLWLGNAGDLRSPHAMRLEDIAAVVERTATRIRGSIPALPHHLPQAAEIVGPD